MTYHRVCNQIDDENQSPGFGQAERYSEEYQSNVHNISILNGF
jgi:hypothetical protein